MKIAVPINGGRLSSHFGHATEFAIVQVEHGTIMEKETLTPPPHQPGILPRWLHNLGVNVIIASGIGQKALKLFEQNSITVISGSPSLSAEDLIGIYLANALVPGDNICDH
jgi:predicted Fe-Mo cluster-binding NifX family protein